MVGRPVLPHYESDRHGPCPSQDLSLTRSLPHGFFVDGRQTAYEASVGRPEHVGVGSGRTSKSGVRTHGRHWARGRSRTSDGCPLPLFSSVHKVISYELYWGNTRGIMYTCLVPCRSNTRQISGFRLLASWLQVRVRKEGGVSFRSRLRSPTLLPRSLSGTHEDSTLGTAPTQTVGVLSVTHTGRVPHLD